MQCREYLTVRHEKLLSKMQAPSEVKEGATFEEYLSTVFPEDDVKEQYIDPLSLKGAPRAMSRTSTDDVSF